MAESKIEGPLYPVIYVRGFAMTQKEIEDTVATPYMGFNLGSSKVRQLWTGEVQRYYFESPLVRLMKDYQYQDVYSDGAEMPPDLEVGPKSIIIYRYYEQASTQLGSGQQSEIEDYAIGLAKLVLQVRDRVCCDNKENREKFRINLVAHSMGGLICRCFLQNSQSTSEDVGLLEEARKLVDKVFTYATPHNGIDLELVGNVSGFLTVNQINVFNRDRMKQYLALPPTATDISSLNGKFDPDRFFCLVGTNEKDYEVAGGWSRRVVGPMSDGLVRVANATISGPVVQNGKQIIKESPRAFVYRSHSGDYGIVNSEEGYQNLRRFLFGDVRVDGFLDIKELFLPPKVQDALDTGKQIRASYHFEVVVHVRGAQWDLHRRTVGENSAVFRKYDEMFKPKNYPADGEPWRPHMPRLFSTFLETQARINPRRRSLGFSIDLGVLVPTYEVDNKFWLDDHYDGGYLYRDGINLEAIPPKEGDDTGSWTLRYGFDSRTPNRVTTNAPSATKDGKLVFRIPVEQKTRPGIIAELVLSASAWNT